MKMLLIVTASIALGFNLAIAQDITQTRLVWRAIESTAIGSGTTKPVECEFVTDGLQSVQWVQKQGTLTSTFQITGSEGTWTNVGSLGSFTYNLENGGRYCKLKLERTTSGLFVTMDFLNSGNSIAKLQFKIETVE